MGRPDEDSTAGPARSTPDGDEWTSERVRAARPVPMPRPDTEDDEDDEGTCGPTSSGPTSSGPTRTDDQH
jgi:hypothetical protein